MTDFFKKEFNKFMARPIGYIINDMELLTRKQIVTRAASRMLEQIIPPAFDTQGAIEQLRKDYPGHFDKVVFYNADTLAAHWQDGQQPAHYPLTKKFIKDVSLENEDTMNHRVRLYSREEAIGISHLKGQSLLDMIKPAPSPIGTELVMRYIFNHEAAHSLDKCAGYQKDVAYNILIESVADTFSLMRMASEKLDQQTLMDFTEQISKMRSFNALEYRDTDHLTVFAVDPLLDTQFKDLAGASPDTIMPATYAHLQTFLPPADYLRKYKKTYDQLEKKWVKRNKKSGIQYLEMVYNELIDRAKQQGTDQYDACFIYTAARAYKTYVEEGYGREDQKRAQYGSRPSEQFYASTKAMFNGAVSTLEQDSHFKKFNIERLKLK